VHQTVPRVPVSTANQETQTASTNAQMGGYPDGHVHVPGIASQNQVHQGTHETYQFWEVDSESVLRAVADYPKEARADQGAKIAHRNQIV
jgi:hypothetical protein